MVIVHIKHYLTDKGINYFINYWFEAAYKLLEQYDGFSSLKYSIDSDDEICINLWLEFNSLSNLKNWRASEKHAELVSRLDIYRTKPYDTKRYLIENFLRYIKII